MMKLLQEYVYGSVYGSVAVERSSNHIVVDGLHRKTSDETLAMLKRYLAEHAVPVDEIHTDGGGEWLGKFASYCNEHRIRTTFTCPYSAFQNQSAEQAVGIVKRGARRNRIASERLAVLCRRQCDWLRSGFASTVAAIISGNGRARF